MLVLMNNRATKEQINRVVEKIQELGFTPHTIPGSLRTAIGITGNQGSVEKDIFRMLEGVADVVSVTKPYKLVSREVKEENTVINVGDCKIGDGNLVVMAGPCSVESEDQILNTAKVVKKAGARFLRGGAFKPRTSPYAFQGLKEEGLKLLAKARDETGLFIVTEVKDTETLPMIENYADVLQIGARNMQNYSLLEAVGRSKLPVLLKRGMSASINDLLMAAEYILNEGNYNVILCERGIRTFENKTRNTLDLNAVPVIQQETHLPIVVDPSHGIGIWSGVAAMAKAAVAAGCDGLMIEVHPEPEKALSDGIQSLKPEKFAVLMKEVKAICKALGRDLT